MGRRRRHWLAVQRFSEFEEPPVGARRADAESIQRLSPGGQGERQALRLARVLLKLASDTEATVRPIRHSIGLKAVPKASVLKHEATLPAKEFTLAEIHRLLAFAKLPMRALVYSILGGA